MPSVLALDQGTTGSTALLIGDDGRIRGRGYREITQHYPQPGWVEHDPEEIWATTCAAAAEALADVRPDAIGITNQRETVVAWERGTGRPVHRALVWQDRRTAARCRELRAAHGTDLVRRTGLVWDPYFSATKIEWLLVRCRACGPAPTGGGGVRDHRYVARVPAVGGGAFVTDHTNASRTLLYSLGTRDWDEELLRLFGSRARRCRRSCRRAGLRGDRGRGAVRRGNPHRRHGGRPAGRLFGQGVTFLARPRTPTARGVSPHAGGDRLPPVDGRVLTTMACDAPGEAGAGGRGAIFVAGAAIQWLRDGLGLVAIGRREAKRSLRSVPDTGGVVFVPALVRSALPTGSRGARHDRGPHPGHDARPPGACGARSDGLRDAGRRRGDDRCDRRPARYAAGGRRCGRHDWSWTYQATVAAVPVLRPDLVESTALGAAGLAGLATGVWPDAGRFMATRTHRRFESVPALGHGAAVGHREWRRACEATLRWAPTGSCNRKFLTHFL